MYDSGNTNKITSGTGNLRQVSSRPARAQRLCLVILLFIALSGRGMGADMNANRSVSPDGASSLSNYVSTLTLTSKSLPDLVIVAEVLPVGWRVTNWSWNGPDEPPTFSLSGGVTNKWLFLTPTTGELSYTTRGSNVIERSYPVSGWVEYDIPMQILPTGGDTSVPARDTDHDGMPDDWEIANNLSYTNGSDAGLDPDGDGMTTVKEYEADTNPRNSNSVLRVLSSELVAEGVARLRWIGGVRSRQELCSMLSLTNNPTGAGAIFTNPAPTTVTNTLQIALPSGAPAVFYFLRVRR